MNKILFIVLLGILNQSYTTFAQTIFVQAEANGSGTSWDDPLGDLQVALSQATAGTEIWITEGEYFPTNCLPCDGDDRAISFEVPVGVALYGGFIGNESTKESRLSNKFTVLNADIGIAGDRADNAYSLITLEFPTTQNVIDGFILKNGNADGGGDSLGPNESGAAIHVKGLGNGGTATPIIQNCQFYNNRAATYGGAIHFFGGFSGSCELYLDNCVFEGNFAQDQGGAISGYAGIGGTITGTIKNSSFRQNRSEEGGAVHLLSASDGSATVNFENDHFSYNDAKDNGGAVLFYTSGNGTNYSTFSNCTFTHNEGERGGALYTDGSNSGVCNISYIGCVFKKNKSINGGAAIQSQGSHGESSPFIKQCIFEENFSIQSGGALYNSGPDGICQPIIDKCQFIRNETTMYGAGMYNFGKTGQCSPVITNCLFRGNISDSGSSIYNYGGQDGNSSPRIINCTFTENFARVGPCVYNQASDTTGTVKTFVSNCIFWDNIATSGFGLVFQNGHAEPTIQYSIIPFDDCALLNTQPNSTLTCGPGILFNQNPNFINPDQLDFRLGEGSPGLNAGIFDNALQDDLDLDNRPRAVDSLDLGAYEWDAVASTMITSISAGGTYCEGESIVLQVNTAGALPTEVQWYFHNDPIVGAIYPLLSLENITTNNSGAYRCEVLGSAGWIVSESISITVEEALIPSVVLAADAESYCQGDDMRTVEATITNEGFFHEFAWSLNGVLLDETTQNYAFTVANLDVLKAELVSSAICIDGPTLVVDSIIFIEQEVVTATVEIDSDKLVYCEGETVILSATTLNGGNQPQIIWELNGTEIQDTGAVIELQNLTNSDQIKAKLISDISCVAEAEVYSESLSVEINPTVEPSIELVAMDDLDSLCLDSLLSFSLLLENEGSSPEIAWWLNGAPIADATADKLDFTFDQVGTYFLQSSLVSNELCASTEPIYSDSLELAIKLCTTTNADEITTLKGYNVFPNPTTGPINIAGYFEHFESTPINIYDVNGRKMSGDFRMSWTAENVNMDLSELHSGMYFIQIIDAKNTTIRSIFLDKN